MHACAWVWWLSKSEFVKKIYLHILYQVVHDKLVNLNFDWNFKVCAASLCFMWCLFKCMIVSHGIFDVLLGLQNLVTFVTFIPHTLPCALCGACPSLNLS